MPLRAEGRAFHRTFLLPTLETVMRRVATLALFAGTLLGLGPRSAISDDAAPPTSTTYQVEHQITVKDIPEGAKRVRIWFWLPDDDPSQKLLDLSVTDAPSGYQITRDPAYGHRYLYAEVAKPDGEVHLATQFTLRRERESIALDPQAAGPLTDDHRALFAEYLRRDCPHMEVNDRVQALADELCGDETNVVLQAHKLFDYVVDNSDHYSKGNTAPKSSGLGSVDYCLDQHGGGCTDQHSLFIALARARGIPTRLKFGTRLKPADEGKPVDPGYRCWVQYFVPRYGWVSMDISAADTNPDQRDYFFSGLDDRRVWFSDGRDLDLFPKQDGPRVNLMIVAYIEVDGQPHTSFQRTIEFTSVKPEVAASR
jgi:transglutaminase-like putative cysteine protease